MCALGRLRPRFFGPCKKRMRPEIQEGDYILGISPANAGLVRRILLWMRVKRKMTFGKAYRRGEAEKSFQAARGHAIHVRPKPGRPFQAGKPACYQHIKGAPHQKTWREDLRGERDVLFEGSDDSWVAEATGPVVTEELVALLRSGIKWGAKATVKNPLTQNARGRHAIVTGADATRLVRLIQRPKHTIEFSDPKSRTSCQGSCECR